VQKHIALVLRGVDIDDNWASLADPPKREQ
jgi:hypothetical protein